MISIKYNPKQKFYFLSTDDTLDGKIIYPRIPKRRMIRENCITRRICIAPSIYWSLKAIPLENGNVFTVYQVNTTEKSKIAQPQCNDVLDAFYTHEHWCLGKVSLTKIGIIKINGYEDNMLHKKDPTVPSYKGCNVLYFNINKNVKYEWIEKIK